jgi:lambda repressor-like predicted transcriptional regulator
MSRARTPDEVARFIGNVSAIARRLNWTRVELARRAEIDLSDVAAFFGGRVNQRVEIAIAAALGVTREELWRGREVAPEWRSTEEPTASPDEWPLPRRDQDGRMQFKSDDHPYLMTSSDVIRILNGVSRKTLDRMRLAGQIESTRVGGKVRYRPEDVRDYIDQNAVTGAIEARAAAKREHDKAAAAAGERGREIARQLREKGLLPTPYRQPKRGKNGAD